MLTNRIATIRASIRDVQFELTLAAAPMVMVTFLSLRSIYATLIPSFVVPLSPIGTFGMMYLSGFPTDNLTLITPAIATGLVVGDTIVMVENITHCLEQGDSSLEAVPRSSKQVSFTIISLAFSLVTVLIPLLFMGDVTGWLFREFAITLTVTILISGFISPTLTSMFSAELLRHVDEGQQSCFARAVGRVIDDLTAQYVKALWVVLRY